MSSFSTVECVVVTCACCGVKAFDDDRSEWAGVIHFDSRDDAVRNVTSTDQDQPWLVEGDQAYCGDCWGAIVCYFNGHDLAEWSQFKPGFRWCDRCGKSVEVPA